MNAGRLTVGKEDLPGTNRCWVRHFAISAMLACLGAGSHVSEAQEPPKRLPAEYKKPVFDWLHRRLTTQIALARRCGQLTKAQTAHLDSLDVTWLTKQLESNLAGNVPPRLPRYSDVQEGQRKIDAAILSTLTGVQKQRFEKAAAESRKFRAEALADAVLVNIELKVFIDEHRRGLLRDKLIAWCTDHDLHASYYFANPTRIPKLPIDELAEVLDDEQMRKLDQFTSFSFASPLYEISMLVHEDAILFREVARADRLRERADD